MDTNTFHTVLGQFSFGDMLLSAWEASTISEQALYPLDDFGDLFVDVHECKGKQVSEILNIQQQSGLFSLARSAETLSFAGALQNENLYNLSAKLLLAALAEAAQQGASGVAYFFGTETSFRVQLSPEWLARKGLGKPPRPFLEKLSEALGRGEEGVEEYKAFW